MANAIAANHVNHLGKANRDYVCTQPDGTTFTLPRDTIVVIVDMNLKRDRFVIWWETKNLYSRLTIQVAQGLIITLPVRRWTTENTRNRMLLVNADVQTVDKFGESITYGVKHQGLVSRMSTDGMSFIVNIFHGTDAGRKGVRINVKYGKVFFQVDVSYVVDPGAPAMARNYGGTFSDLEPVHRW